MTVLLPLGYWAWPVFCPLWCQREATVPDAGLLGEAESGECDLAELTRQLDSVRTHVLSCRASKTNGLAALVAPSPLDKGCDPYVQQQQGYPRSG